jgi:hypothetical protein
LFSRPRDSSLSGESRRRRREKVEDVADADSAQREHGVARVAHFNGVSLVDERQAAFHVQPEPMTSPTRVDAADGF